MSVFRSAITLLGNCTAALRGQMVLGLSVPLDTEEDGRVMTAPRSNKRLDLCEERPGRMCRNGYGSLEVGGLRDRVDD
ncbi:MAG: hypothetical protein ACOVPA_05165 [Rubrivivax sp.]